MEQKHDLRSNPVTEKHIKHEFLHGKVKEPIKMLNVFYAWKVSEALFLWNLLKKREKLSNHYKRDKLTCRNNHCYHLALAIVKRTR